eukprot:c12806_g1_i1.p1 GENE.c12806_g1_i1~~c12806_g1_i1.p1  ORF type:complete len:244 (+),score=34.95 c12806_g1_i1:223-954(+)
MLELFSRLFVRWVHEGVLRRFGPDSEIDTSTIEHFVRCLESGFQCGTEVFVVAAVYLIRLHECCDRDINARHAILASVSLAYKFLSDTRPNMKLHAYSGGVTLDGLVALESAMLSALDYRLFVTAEEYTAMKNMIENESLRTNMWTAHPQSSFMFSSTPSIMHTCLVDTAVPAAKHIPQVNYTPFTPSVASLPTYNHFQPTCAPIAAAVATPASAATANNDWMALINPSCVDFSSWSHAVFPG